ncbi:hypothetical protein GHT06_005404 [Daphnia sinensis]|uniref:AIG1-type G domain-containing protein n=1 Tax=Daphnia sinensis TaxID=1820382 RepID=A0AAD5KVS3_9CRUS|nr:hypothetical protein GHT06_005404 [Daphnia sinensis]
MYYMADPIRISALGRDGKVGDLYNYFTDVIVPIGSIDVPNKRKMISTTVEKPTFAFFYQQPEKFKSLLLGINSHLLQNMKQWSVSGHQLWFNDYLNSNSMDGDEEHAQVTLLFRVVRRTETLDQDFLRSKIDEYQLKSGEVGASHVIDEVVYGAEVICSMRKALDSSQETKEATEVSMYLAAKTYLDETIMKTSTAELPVELNQVSCMVLSSLEPGKKYKVTFELLNRYLQDLLKSDKEENQQKWKPIDFLLRNIPAIRIEARLWSDRKIKVDLEKERHQVTKKWMVKYIREISDNPSLERFPLLEKHVCYFQDLVTHFWKKVDEAYKICETLPPENALAEMIIISDCLNKIIDWFAYRRKNIQEIGLLLSGTEFELLTSEEIEDRMASNNYKMAKLFTLKVEYKQDSILNDMQRKLFGQQTSNTMLPVLTIFSCDKERLTSVRAALSEFANEAKLARWGSGHDTTYHIGVTSSTSDDGTIVTLDYSYQPPRTVSVDNPVKYCKEKDQQQFLFSSPSVSAPLSASPLTTTLVPNQNQQLKSDKYGERINYSYTNSAGNSHTELMDPEQDKMDIESHFSDVESSDGDCSQEKTGWIKIKPSTKDSTKMSITSKDQIEPKKNETGGGRGNGRIKDIRETDLSFDQVPNKVGGTQKFDLYADQGYTTHRNMVPRDNRRIAEIYADESSSYSKWIRKGSPNVYLLNANEKSNSGRINWFDICRPGDPVRSDNSKNHKIIMLMGATGSGKSTLINGMINYILGVRWNDPFRFKCVREDEGVARNQAHSQTSSVTAYTLRHQEGMAIPYSITIIDTPGYGDTRGVKRDKEITAAIHSFLTQQEIPIDEIHAACFVAASGDSRLTATQRYIIDSVLSIFGKDMKANLRLLVTFADNADPPVVGACLSANFPTTSASGSIAYSKFNSSVLYCPNAKQGDDEFSFDQLFWDMGHENFKKFFNMLETMKGRDLTSTREVIRSRHQLEQSLKDIEQEMEVCLTKIENIEVFQRKMKTYDHNMEATKNFKVEQTVMRSRKFNCEKGFFAYNCDACKDTCERFITKKSSLHKTKRRCEKKACKCPASDHYVEEREWRMISEKVSKTLQDMKAEYELNCEGKMTAEKILNACSEDLQIARAKVLSLLEQVAKNVDLLESTALRSNVLSPSDYLSLMRSRVLEEQAPGYLTRLETLDDLQRMLAGGSSQPIRSTVARPNQELTRQSPNTDRESYSAATSNYSQAYSKGQTTQPTPVYGDGTECKPGRSLTSKVGSFFGLGKTA